ncbi:MAG: hypothetical protein HOB82_08225 [Alphaproteobacteria bacterium]|nr:hypothetical protein [Alphaproteobacteria bacterium]MBT4711497.1 hypothetical protein [Alphaproteobacteria bacterium]MBT5860719.1 hypothetical protein [Alphaproteobacteria bacterium]
MAKPTGNGGIGKKGAEDAAERQSRQSEALRENLRRRKNQSRQRAQSPDQAPTPKKIRPS